MTPVGSSSSNNNNNNNNNGRRRTGALVLRNRPGVGKLGTELKWENDFIVDVDIDVDDVDASKSKNNQMKKKMKMIRNQVEVQVEAVGLNVDDIHLMEGTMIVPVSAKIDSNFGVVPGMELSGTTATIIDDDRFDSSSPSHPSQTTTKPTRRRAVVGIKPCIYQTRGTWSCICHMKDLWLADAPNHLSLLESAALPIAACAALQCIRQSNLEQYYKFDRRNSEPESEATTTTTMVASKEEAAPSKCTTSSGISRNEQKVEVESFPQNNDPKPTVVVVGAAGGIGTILVQMLVNAGNDKDTSANNNNKSRPLHVIAVSSPRSKEICVQNCYAHEWVDRADHEAIQNLLDDIQSSKRIHCLAIFDLVGGLEIENMYYFALASDATYVTMNGPIEWLGEGRNSFFTTIMYIIQLLWRLAVWNYVLTGRAKYRKVEVPPNDHVGNLLRDAMNIIQKRKIRPIIDTIVDFDYVKGTSGGSDNDDRAWRQQQRQPNQLTAAIAKVRHHKAHGKVLLNFNNNKRRNLYDPQCMFSFLRNARLAVWR